MRPENVCTPPPVLLTQPTSHIVEYPSISETETEQKITDSEIIDSDMDSTIGQTIQKDEYVTITPQGRGKEMTPLKKPLSTPRKHQSY